MRMSARVLVPAECNAMVVRSDRPLSFWGGMDAKTGAIIDRRHDRWGASLVGCAFVFPGEKGSSTGSAVLLELIRIGRAPAAIVSVLGTPVLALGSIVADELYGRSIPVLAVSQTDMRGLVDGTRLTVSMDGSMILHNG